MNTSPLPRRHPLRIMRSSLPAGRWTLGVLTAVFSLASQPDGPCYVISNPSAKWPAGEIKFRTLLGDAGRVLIDGNTSWNDVAIGAAFLWNEELRPVRLAVTPGSGEPGSRDGISQAGWSDTVYGQTFGGAIAVAVTWSSGGKVVESDILVNENSEWDSFRGPLSGHGSTNDLRRVLAHEFGHSLGLHHPDEAGQNVDAIMNSIASDIDEPAADDIAGILAIFPPESTRPTVSIKTPSSGARIFGETAGISGSASDNALAEHVVYQLNGGPETDAITTNVAPSINWSASVTLRPGSNTIAARSIDTSGNLSSVATRNLFRVVTNVIQLLSSGSGNISPNLNGLGLEIGRPYTITAIPSAGHVFSNWSGALTASTARLTFLMESNLQLQANFTTNPFVPAAGNFTGLFIEAGSVRHESSGSVSLKLTDKGKYSGKLLVAGRSHSFSGTFDLMGQATNVIKRTGASSPLMLNLQLGIQSNEPNQISGEITDGSWTAELRANRAVFNPGTAPAPLAGAYTFVLPGTNDPAFGPAGDSYATGRIDAGGASKFNGKLADGASISIKARLSTSGEWPLYLSLYSGKGSLIGWMTTTNDPAVPWGTIHWFKPPSLKGLHTGGFTNQTIALGSFHAPPVTKTNRVLNLTNGVVTFSDGNLIAPLDFTFTVSNDNKVTSTNAGLAMSFSTANGLFKGAFVDPATQRKHTFNGVLRQNANEGSGCFAGTNESGWVNLQPAP